MKNSMLLMAATAGLGLQACTTPQSVTSDGMGLEREQASIAFANQRSAVTSWQADGREGLWVESGRGEWYYAKFFAPCIGVDHAVQVGFDTGTSERLDRFSHVIVPNERERCAIMSFTKSDPPPDGDRRTFKAEDNT